MFKHIYTFRVKPGRELITDISQYCSDHGISSGLIIGIIGSVLGGFLLDNVFRRLTDIYNINVLSSVFLSCVIILIYSLVTPGGDKR